MGNGIVANSGMGFVLLTVVSMTTESVFVTSEWSVLTLILMIVIMVLVVAFVVFMERGERRLPVQYAQRVVGRRVVGGQATYMPMKINMGGVIPPVFAVSLLAFPQTMRSLLLAKHSAWLGSTLAAFGYGGPLYYVSFIVLNIFVCLFYISIIFNPSEAADNMRKYGGFVPGIRPGKNTADYMNAILTRLTMVPARYISA